MAELCRSDIVQVDLSHGLMRKHVGSILATGDKYGNRFGAEIFRDGVPIDIHGFAVTGYFLRPNKDAIFIVGSTAGNTAFVTLPQACYIDAGSFTLALKISSEDYTTTVRIVDGYILLTQTDDLVDPGEAVPTLDDIFAQIAAMETATASAKEATELALAAKDNANGAAVYAVNIATEKGNQAIQLAQEEADKQNVKIATLTEEMDGKVMAGVGRFSTDDWLPLVSDLNEATPNRIVAIPKGDYSANVPGTGAESQGTLIPFAYRNSADVECQVQLFVTLSEKLYFRNKWGRDDAWNPWVLVATSAEVTNAVKNSVSGIGQFVSSDSLPLIEDANDVAPNTILAIAKANYVQNMPGRQGDSQGTLMHFAYANRADANCQVQILVTPERKVWVRNLWGSGDGWGSWVQLDTKVTFYVGGGDKATHTRLLDAINDANALPDHIHVDIMVCQNVNLYEELGGADYVASFTDATNPNAGPTLRTNVDLIGVGMPSVRLECPDDVATYNFTYSVSPLNLKGTNKLSGIVFVGKNTRYVIHDEGGGHGDYNRIVENCYFYHNGTFDGGWYSGQAYGAGTGHSGAYLFDGCVFESPKMPFSIHNNHNVVRPIVKFVNCVFKGGAGYPGARFGTYGSGYVQGNVFVNGCRSSGVIRTVTEGDYDTFNDAGFQIIPGDTVYRTDLAKLTYYAGNDVWKEI